MDLLNTHAMCSLYYYDAVYQKATKYQLSKHALALDTQDRLNDTDFMMNIDQLIHTANFGNLQERAQAQLEIWNLAQEKNIIPCSIYDLYQARAEEKIPLDFTVPAFNLRGLSYHSAQEVFRSAQEHSVGTFIFEIARSEMGYTAQNPGMYMANILAAAIKTNWQGPVFIQGDHFQSKPKDKQINKQDVDKIIDLIRRSILAGFFNIDLDGSLLIKTSKDALQSVSNQENNAKYTADLSNFIRQNQDNINISLGAEINPIGGSHNSTPKDLDAFMQLYESRLGNKPGISKVAIQTGTAHGGTVNPDGSVKKAQVSFETIKKLSEYARKTYDLGGVVQHGASTLDDNLFAKFAESQTLEIHLSTGFQNLILDHSSFPKELLSKMYTWIDKNCQNERKAEHNEEQFHYKLRKKAWKEFKKETWEINPELLEEIMSDMKKRFDFYFQSLNVINTQDLVNKYIRPIKITRKLEDFIFINQEEQNDLKGLAD